MVAEESLEIGYGVQIAQWFFLCFNENAVYINDVAISALSEKKGHENMCVPLQKLVCLIYIST